MKTDGTAPTDPARAGHLRGMKLSSTLAAFFVYAGVFASTPSCGGGVDATAGTSGAPNLGTVASADGIGDQCIPQQERDPSFLGFGEKEVSLETRSPSCKTGVCMINHFRGRTSCPYGQDANGLAPPGSKPCVTTGPGSAVTGGEPPRDLGHKALVHPQCIDRPAAATVYCSCRCANAQGRTDDGARYCGCSAGFECTSLVTSIGKDSDSEAGSYCVKTGTAYDRSTACNAGDCDPIAATCR